MTEEQQDEVIEVDEFPDFEGSPYCQTCLRFWEERRLAYEARIHELEQELARTGVLND